MKLSKTQLDAAVVALFAQRGYPKVEGAKPRDLFHQAELLSFLAERFEAEMLTPEDFDGAQQQFIEHLTKNLARIKRQVTYRANFVYAGLKEKARALRAAQTPAEEMMWALLRNRQLAGLKFRRQHQIGPYIADFYCDDLRIVVELDGPIHETPEHIARDKKRDAYLKALGFNVLRCKNQEFVDHPEAFFEQILKPSPCPLPEGEGGTGAGAGIGRGQGPERGQE